MRKLLIILMVGSLFAQESPCEDETYLELKEKELEEMTDREYQYFLLKDEACMNYNNAQEVIQAQQSASALPNLLALIILAVLVQVGIMLLP